MLHSLAPLAAACQNRHLHASGGKVNRVPETRAACGWVVQDRGKRQDKRRERVSGVGWGDEGVVRLLRRDTRSAGGAGGGGNGEICFQRHLCLLRRRVQPLVPPHPISSVFGVSYPVKHCHLNFMGFVTRRRTLSVGHLSGAKTRSRGKQNRSSWRRDRLQGKVFRVAGSLQSRAGFCDEDLMRPKLLDSVFGVRGVIHHCWRSPWLVTAL